MNKKIINTLVILIISLTLIVSLVGILTSRNSNEFEYQTINNQIVKIYGSGVYKNDSLSTVSQGIAQDFISILIGIPLLIYSLIKFNKKSVKGKLLLSGTLGYFLYTYMSYTFVWQYNYLFLLYVALMSLSTFALIITINTIDINNLKNSFNNKLPYKTIGIIQIFIGIMIGLMWLSKIIPTLINGGVPDILEHYTTLVIQGMDLAFIMPLAIISGLMLMKQKSLGYLLSSIVIIKGSALLISITAMIIGQIIAGVDINYIIVGIFILFDLLIIYPLIVLIKNIKE